MLEQNLLESEQSSSRYFLIYSKYNINRFTIPRGTKQTQKESLLQKYYKNWEIC